MQTKQQIQRLLASAGISPNQRRGQNFLIDLNLMRLLLDSAGIYSNDIVLEVGCGTGSLTQGLAKMAGQVIGVEIDPILAKITERELPKGANVKIIVADILESKNTIDSSVIRAIESAREKYTGRVLLVANLPYSVACPVMLNLVTGPVVADCMYVTVQKEVAERMTAAPNSRHYGSLSILLGATGDVKMERVLRPTVFWPQPQVDSAMVSFVRRKEKTDKIHDMEILGEVVSLFMGHRRKMLKACTKLSSGKLGGIHNWPVIFEDCIIDPHHRPEDITVDNYIAVANLCSELLKKN